jgi:hypothetical protein
VRIGLGVAMPGEVLDTARHTGILQSLQVAENMKGVIDAKWNPRTREVTVRYDAKVTSARNIKHFMA